MPPKQEISLYGKVEDLDRHTSDLVAAGHNVRRFPYIGFNDVDVYMTVSCGHTHSGSHSVSVGLVYWKYHGPAFPKKESVGAWDGF